jgi:hypothetical protein
MAPSEARRFPWQGKRRSGVPGHGCSVIGWLRRRGPALHLPRGASQRKATIHPLGHYKYIIGLGIAY